MKKILAALLVTLFSVSQASAISIWGTRSGDTYLNNKATWGLLDAYLTPTGLGQIGPGLEGLTPPTYRPGVGYWWYRYDGTRWIGPPLEAWPNQVRRLRVDSLGVNITGPTEFHNITTRFYGVVNPTGTDMLLYAVDSIGTVPMPVSIGVSRYFTFQTTGANAGDLDLLASGGDIRLLNDGAIRMKDTGGTYQASLYTSGTNILKLRPLASGQSVRIQNAADNATNLEVADNGKTTALTMIADSTRSNGGMFVGGDKITKILRGSFTLDVGSITLQSSRDETVTITGLDVASNWTAIVQPLSADMTAGVGIVSARVSADNTLKIRFENDTVGNIDPASQTFSYVAFK